MISNLFKSVKVDILNMDIWTLYGPDMDLNMDLLPFVYTTILYLLLLFHIFYTYSHTQRGGYA